MCVCVLSNANFVISRIRLLRDNILYMRVYFRRRFSQRCPFCFDCLKNYATQIKKQKTSRVPVRRIERLLFSEIQFLSLNNSWTYAFLPLTHQLHGTRSSYFFKNVINNMVYELARADSPRMFTHTGGGMRGSEPDTGLAFCSASQHYA